MSDSTKATPTPESGESAGPLKRVLGTKLLLLLVVGDILGTTIYSLTGAVSAQVGGALWVPFVVAFVVAFLTAFSYLELVTKYPRAAGAALYVHRAFGVHFLTFMVAFAVMCSGITSASSAAQAFSGDYLQQVLGTGYPPVLLAIGFILVIAAVNLRGIGESAGLNAVLTVIELSGLVIVICTGLYAIFLGTADPTVAPDPGRLLEFNTETSPFIAVTSATALAFFAMVGFEDSVNMVEEVKNPVKTFPRALLLGMCVAAAVYLVIAVVTSTLVPSEELADSTAPLLLVVQAAAPWFPPVLFAVIALFAVTNTALVNMLMSSRLLFGMANERVIPRQLGSVLPSRRTPWVAILFTSGLAIIMVSFLDIASLGGTTSLLLLMVFSVVNVSVLVLRREKVEHEHFKAPTIAPVLAVVLSVFFASPLTGRPLREYAIAGILLAIGVVFWFANYAITRNKRFSPEKLNG
ncbi:APC family permease [Streptomonospora nanhaiensis]|uniref:Amino acid transporter n=1 Tax=Streptomonospora nanhaiensis TaxID=1323731 RepID=A0A853BIE1_9ACTN|nr:APC family permease [Streptomonospora nanhaiensis]MBV2367208.1 APC family permease [Streptomonospora nanhaiensis]MBX9391130.1 APC family permease [Streptomonospora nanhaiensis]NYI95189.1 amino acid transporter [Streptomonospora nanhaiensis]